MIQTCYQSESSRVTETTIFDQNCFSVENLTIVSLNTVIASTGFIFTVHMFHILFIAQVSYFVHFVGVKQQNRT